MAKKHTNQEIDVVSQELEALKKQSEDYALGGEAKAKKNKKI